MNITMSADEKLIEKARAIASSQGKSLNQLVRDYLEAITSRGVEESGAEALFALMDEGGGSLEGRTWTREELHER